MESKSKLVGLLSKPESKVESKLNKSFFFKNFLFFKATMAQSIFFLLSLSFLLFFFYPYNTFI